jgi:lysophospholipase L1-like esterase
MQIRTFTLLATLSLSGTVAAQGPDGIAVGIVDEPCPPPVALPASAQALLTDLFMRPHTLSPEDTAALNNDASFRDYLGALRQMGNRDWPALCRFSADNKRLIATGVKPDLVFMGDSITENWLLGDTALFNDNYVNRGIGGQTTPQMLLRFRADVVALKPRAVHIMTGTNDIAGNTGPSTVDDFRNNVMSMVEVAKANGIDVLLGSIPPAAAFSWAPDLKPAPRVRELNAWLQEYAAQQDLTYIDYYTALAGADGELRSELGNDGVHPNREGYVIMRRLLEEALARSN